NALHPGFVNTGFAKDQSLFSTFFGVLQKYFAITPEKGAQTSIYLATNQELNGVTGRYFVESKPVPSSRASYDYTARRKLWELSTKLMNDHLRI
ncbi:MAG: short-chain dehydrogenase, partial [Chloroflexota bacterium]